jgi:tRNA pseudouridine55 synthase
LGIGPAYAGTLETVRENGVLTCGTNPGTAGFSIPDDADRLEIADMPSADTTVFEAECGRGTYVRAIARDIGRTLGCLGHVTALRRTRVGPFEEAQAVTIPELEEAAAIEDGGVEIKSLLRPVESALADLLEVNVSQSDAARLARGQPVLLRGRDAPVMSGEAFALSKGTLIALCEIERGELRPLRVFNQA